MDLLGSVQALGDGIANTATAAAESAADALESAEMASKIPGRGIIWEIDLIDPQKFTLTPLGRYALGALAAYGVYRFMGRR